LILVGLGPWAISAQQAQKQEPPKWLNDAGKDAWNDVVGAEHAFNAATCETREGLLKSMMGASDPQAAQFRFMTLKELGLCEFIAGRYEKSKKRLDSGVSELNLPNDDMMKTNQDLAPTGLLREAAAFLMKHELTQAATALRRSREIEERNVKKILKMLHNQMKQQGAGGGNVPPLDNLVSEISGYGRTGQILPMLMPQAPILKQELGFFEQLDALCEEIDKKIAGFAPQAKDIRKNLDVSKGSKAGTLMYVRGLVTEPIANGDRLMAAMDMIDLGVIKAFKEEGAAVEKGVTLLKRSKDGKGCKEGAGFDKTCAAVKQVADLKSNIFGETRVVVLKAGKKQPLDSCSTNANVAILVAAADGVSVTVGKAGTETAETKELLAGLPIVVDFCQEVNLDGKGAVLFAQAWHPEYAAVERTGEIRSRSKTFDLTEDEVKDVTKVANDFAKKHWEKAGKQWRNESPLVDSIKNQLAGAKDAAKVKAETDAEAKRKEDEGNDETRKKNLADLEAKREEKKQARLREDKRQSDRKKMLEAERQDRDPWLKDPEVLAAEDKLNGLKEARRDANAKLEFDLTAQLTKDISATERALKKATKVAKKAFKKAGGVVSEKPVAEPSEVYDSKAAGHGGASFGGKADAKEEKVDNTKKVAEIKKKLDDVKKKKVKAAEDEDFGAAKTLKATQADLESQLKKLEL